MKASQVEMSITLCGWVVGGWRGEGAGGWVGVGLCAWVMSVVVWVGAVGVCGEGGEGGGFVRDLLTNHDSSSPVHVTQYTGYEGRGAYYCYQHCRF